MGGGSVLECIIVNGIPVCYWSGQNILLCFEKVEFMTELLYWIALDCTGVSNTVGGVCVFFLLLKHYFFS